MEGQRNLKKDRITSIYFLIKERKVGKEGEINRQEKRTQRNSIAIITIARKDK